MVFFFWSKTSQLLLFVVSWRRVLSNWHCWSPRLMASEVESLSKSWSWRSHGESPCVCAGSRLSAAGQQARSRLRGEPERGRTQEDERGERRERQGAERLSPVLPFCKYLLSSTVHPALSVCVCVYWALGRHLADVCVGRMLNEQMNGRRNQRYWKSTATQSFFPQ